MRRISAILLLLSATVTAQAPARRVIDFESEHLVRRRPALCSGRETSSRMDRSRDEASPERGNVAQTDADSTSYRFP
jgi:hypothetical protein